MGRKNPFIFKYTKNKLLLLTDLQGQIVHVSGRTKIINKTPRTLLHKNFFKDLLSQQTKSHLYQQFKSLQIMPNWMNQRSFQATIEIQQENIRNIRNIRDRQKIYQCFQVRCFRICVKFARILSYFKPVRVRKVRTQKQFERLKQSQGVKQLVMVYIEPLSASVCEKSKQVQVQKQKQKQVQKEREIIIIDIDVDQNNGYTTPTKKQKQKQETTEKVLKQNIANIGVKSSSQIRLLYTL